MALTTVTNVTKGDDDFHCFPAEEFVIINLNKEERYFTGCRLRTGGNYGSNCRSE